VSGGRARNHRRFGLALSEIIGRVWLGNRRAASGSGSASANAASEEAPTSAAEAATIILNGVKTDQWRIRVGPDAHKIDELVRRSPERAHDVDFFEQLAREAGWRLPT
jgi:hypothetical protein